MLRKIGFMATALCAGLFTAGASAQDGLTHIEPLIVPSMGESTLVVVDEPVIIEPEKAMVVPVPVRAAEPQPTPDNEEDDGQ